ncbi:MAG: glycosyltransferase family 4 protein [Planctomycetota bacterium]|jgi:glycosyltransferase involved in cell wall biosynthesis
MKLMLLTPGTGHFYCGSCLRDSTLASAMRKLGHHVDVVPLYLPLVLEEHEQPQAVQMGGINVYLQQKTRLANVLPRFVTDLLDRPGLLRWASRRGNLTTAKGLGAMTLSMLQGEDGRQSMELDKLVATVAEMDSPDVIVISNAMLSGMVRRLRQSLDCPVVATLQGEAPFLDALPEPFRGRAWQTLRERAVDIDKFVPVSHSYGDLMRERLELDNGSIRVIYNGVDLSDLRDDPEPLSQRRPRTIGYLARMCRDKGLHTLIDAFLLLADRGQTSDLQLRVAGAQLKEDRALVRELQGRLQSHGCGGRAEFLPNITRAEKLDFLRSLTVFSVPATYGESFGLYLLEAMACGVPVVQPRHAVFPEILEATGGGVLCEPDDPVSLANTLEVLLQDEPRAQELATCGRRSVFERFSSERMAREFEAVCNEVRRAP